MVRPAGSSCSARARRSRWRAQRAPRLRRGRLAPARAGARSSGSELGDLQALVPAPAANSLGGVLERALGPAVSPSATCAAPRSRCTNRVALASRPKRSRMVAWLARMNSRPSRSLPRSTRSYAERPSVEAVRSNRDCRPAAARPPGASRLGFVQAAGLLHRRARIMRLEWVARRRRRRGRARPGSSVRRARAPRGSGWRRLSTFTSSTASLRLISIGPRAFQPEPPSRPRPSARLRRTGTFQVRTQERAGQRDGIVGMIAADTAFLERDRAAGVALGAVQIVGADSRARPCSARARLCSASDSGRPAPPARGRLRPAARLASA
jgi:hypothetical protein